MADEKALAAPQASQKQKEQLNDVRKLLTSMRDQIMAAVPKHMSADRLIRIAMTSVQKNPALLDCASITLIGAVVQCAQLGLEPDDGTGKAYLVPFFNNKKNRREVQFIPGYKGLIQLARNSGDVISIEAHAVHEKDTFDFSFGLEPILKHTPSRDVDTGKSVAFYAVARFKDGTSQFDVMLKTEVDKVRERSKASGAGPWVTDYDEMGKKTVIRRLSKVLPASAEKLHIAAMYDEKAEQGIPQDLGVVIDTTELGTPTDPVPGPIEDPKALVPPVSANPGELPIQTNGDAKITSDQRKLITELLIKHKVSINALQSHIGATYNAANTSDLPASKFEEVCAWIKQQQKS